MPVWSAYQDNSLAVPLNLSKGRGRNMFFFLPLISKTTWLKALGFGDYEAANTYCTFTIIADSF